VNGRQDVQSGALLDGAAVFRGQFLVVTAEHHFEQSDDGVQTDSRVVSAP
jgi:hypothetical protein